MRANAVSSISMIVNLMNSDQCVVMPVCDERGDACVYDDECGVCVCDVCVGNVSDECV